MHFGFLLLRILVTIGLDWRFERWLECVVRLGFPQLWIHERSQRLPRTLPACLTHLTRMAKPRLSSHARR